MDVSVIIVNYRSKEFVREAVRSFKRLGSLVSYEIIVVDNSEDEGLEELLHRRFEGVSYIKLLKNIGYASGINAGIRCAKGRYLLIANYDIIALPGLLDTFVQHMDENPSVGIAGPCILNPDGSRQDSCFRFYHPFTPACRRLAFGRFARARKHLEDIFLRNEDLTKPLDVDWLLGAALFVRRSMLDVVGPMDSRFFLYFEDMDWCKRFWQKGFTVRYLPSAKIIHLYGRISASHMGLRSLFDPITRTHIASGIAYFLKHWRSYASR